MPSPHSPLTFFLLRSVLILATMVAVVGSNHTKAEEPGSKEVVQLVVPLDKNGHYSLHSFHAECNRKLGTSFRLKGQDRRIALSESARDILEFAVLFGVFSDVDFKPDRFTIALKKPRDKKQRTRIQEALRWPPGTGLQVSAGFKPRQPTMLLIHGLESGPADMRRLEMACRASGIQTLIFDYPNDGPLAQSGKRLNADLKRFARRYPQTRFTIVAHSMGGLVARYCLEQADQSPDCVTDLVTLATPHHGSSLASIQPWIELVFSVFPSKWNLHNDGLGQAANDLRPGSKFLENLNARPRQKGVRYHVAIGRKGFLTDKNAKPIEQRLETLMARAKLAQHERTSVRQFIRSPELRTGLGDGAVTVRSATLKDVASTRQFDLDHREIYQLPGKAPEKSLVFSWILEVLDWDTSLKPPSR